MFTAYKRTNPSVESNGLQKHAFHQRSNQEFHRQASSPQYSGGGALQYYETADLASIAPYASPRFLHQTPDRQGSFGAAGSHYDQQAYYPTLEHELSSHSLMMPAGGSSRPHSACAIGYEPPRFLHSNGLNNNINHNNNNYTYHQSNTFVPR